MLSCQKTKYQSTAELIESIFNSLIKLDKEDINCISHLHQRCQKFKGNSVKNQVSAGSYCTTSICKIGAVAQIVPDTISWVARLLNMRRDLFNEYQ